MKSIANLLKAFALSLVLVTSAFAADKVNINTADAAQLEADLIGIGPSKAEAIVDYRDTNGPFKSPEELAMVKGIGLKTIEKNRDRIELRTPAVPAKRAGGSKPDGKKPAALTRR